MERPAPRAIPAEAGAPHQGAANDFARDGESQTRPATKMNGFVMLFMSFYGCSGALLSSNPAAPKDNDPKVWKIKKATRERI